MTDWGIPDLRRDQLFDRVPHGVFVGKPDNPPELFLWRSVALEKARGHVVAFFRHDEIFQAVVNDPDKYAALFLQHGVAAVCEPDCSLWRDDPIEKQVQSVRMARGIGRRWQDAGVVVAPVLNWADPESYEFAFLGVPHRPPVIIIECRTLRLAADWPYFFTGLHAAVQRVRPQSIVVYGGWERRHWLSAYLPAGPTYRLLPSWQTARNWQRQQQQHNQLKLFGGEQRWGAGVVAGAVPAAALG